MENSAKTSFCRRYDVVRIVWLRLLRRFWWYCPSCKRFGLRLSLTEKGAEWDHRSRVIEADEKHERDLQSVREAIERSKHDGQCYDIRCYDDTPHPRHS